MKRIGALKSIERVTILRADPATGRVTAEVVHKRKKKKQSKRLRVFERLARQGAQAGETMSDNYLERHHKSNRQRKNGWARDYGYNLLQAMYKGGRKIKLWKLLD